MSRPYSRRSILALGAAGAAAGLAPTRPARAARPSEQAAAGGFRIALLTDAHLRAPDDPESPDEHRGNERIRAAFEAVRAAGAQLVVFGGDNVMAVDYGNTVESATKQFENWRRVVARELAGIPSISVIGNHDIWRGEHAAAHAKGGKAYALDVFGMPGRYYHHDAGGWRFCMLDTFHDDGCHIDDEQFAWLREAVDATDRPVCLVGHAPIVTVGQFLEQKEPGVHGGYNAPRGWVVGNAADVVRFCAERPRVRLSLCGHMHQVEDIDYLGTRWVDGGAVSGAWWGGVYLGHHACSLMVIDLAPDGGSYIQSINYEA